MLCLTWCIPRMLKHLQTPPAPHNPAINISSNNQIMQRENERAEAWKGLLTLSPHSRTGHRGSRPPASRCLRTSTRFESRARVPWRNWREESQQKARPRQAPRAPASVPAPASVAPAPALAGAQRSTRTAQLQPRSVHSDSEEQTRISNRLLCTTAARNGQALHTRACSVLTMMADERVL